MAEHQHLAGLGAGGEENSRRQPVDALLPFVAPHLVVDVDDVVVGDGHPEETVGDRECAQLVGGPVVPDHPDPGADDLHAVPARSIRASEHRAGAELVGGAGFGDDDVLHDLTGADRDVPERALERTREVEGDVLPHHERAVRLHLDGDVGDREVERLRFCRSLQDEQWHGHRHQPGDGEYDSANGDPRPQNSTLGTLRASSSTSKYGRVRNPVRPATMLEGMVCTALL